MIAQQFGIVNISASALLQNEIRNNPESADVISDAISEGKPVPDQYINSLVENRLKQSDCQTNGWVLEGYPDTRGQINHFCTMIRTTPSQVFLLEQSEGDSVQRLQSRRVDPETGHSYNLALEAPADQAVRERLIEQKADNYALVTDRIESWNQLQSFFEENFPTKLRRIPADRSINEVNDEIAELVQNPQ